MVINYTEMNEVSVKDIYLSSNWSDIIFGLYIFGEVMAFPCYLFVFYHLLAHRTARTALYNHTTLAMLLFNFISLTIDMPLVLSFMQRGVYVPFTPALCLFHQFVNCGIWYAAIFSMIWLSFERHILIFHSSLTLTARGRCLFHYIPLAIFSLYVPVFYFYITFIYPCERKHDAYTLVCGGPWCTCSFSRSLRWYVTIVHSGLLAPVIVIISGSLLVRVIIQKRRLQRGNAWKQNRKMILQFIFISATFIILDLPLSIHNIMRRIGAASSGTNVELLVNQMANVPAMVLPYATAITLPNIKQKLRMLIFCKPIRNGVNPSNQQT